MNVEQAKIELLKLLARVEAGEEVETARNGAPVARLVKAEQDVAPGRKFLASKGVLAGKIRIGDDFEFSDQELDEILDEQS